MKKYLKPCEGRRVKYKNKLGQVVVLPQEGALVEWNSYAMNRVKDGDAVVAEPPKTKASKPAPKIAIKKDEAKS